MPLSFLFLPMAREMYNKSVNGEQLPVSAACSPLSVHRSLFTVHCSPFTVHCSLFTEFIWLFSLKFVSLQKLAFRFYYQRAEKPYNS